MDKEFIMKRIREQEEYLLELGRKYSEQHETTNARVMEINKSAVEVLEYLKKKLREKVRITYVQKSDWSKPCVCPEEDQIGQSWCCNTCGRMTSRDEGAFADDKEVAILGMALQRCGYKITRIPKEKEKDPWE